MRQNRAITIKKGVWAMDFNLRGAVIQNITYHNQEQLEHTILDAIQSGEKKMLPKPWRVVRSAMARSIRKREERDPRDTRARLKASSAAIKEVGLLITANRLFHLASDRCFHPKCWITPNFDPFFNCKHNDHKS